MAGIVNTIQSLFVGGKKKPGNAVAARLLSLSSDADSVTNNILALMVGATVELSQCKLFARLYWQSPAHLV